MEGEKCRLSVLFLSSELRWVPLMRKNEILPTGEESILSLTCSLCLSAACRSVTDLFLFHLPTTALLFAGRVSLSGSLQIQLLQLIQTCLQLHHQARMLYSVRVLVVALFMCYTWKRRREIRRWSDVKRPKKMWEGSKSCANTWSSIDPLLSSTVSLTSFWSTSGCSSLSANVSVQDHMSKAFT